jgi:hypothetical protein
MTEGPTDHPSGRLPARDLVDVRLSAAIAEGGCAVCGVRARSERGTLDAILAERVLDLGFRQGLERDHAFCRRHARELIEADRRAAGILGSSILYGAMITRRVAALRAAMGSRGRTRRGRLERVLRRPPCQICAQGISGVDVALARLVERAPDAAWGPVIAAIPFCLDDLTALLAMGGDAAPMVPIAEAQLARLEALAVRLDRYAYHSAQDRRHLLTDDERSAADEAARVLGGG